MACTPAQGELEKACPASIAPSPSKGVQAAGGESGSADSSHAVPDHLLCPISMSLMIDPVCTSDGFTYERSVIEEWLQHHDASPLTGAPLDASILVPNLFARSMVREFAEAHPELHECVVFQRQLAERRSESP